MNIDLYRSLFIHRDDVFAQQHADGSYTPVKKPLSDINLAFHLKGDESYGVYVIEPEAVSLGTATPDAPPWVPNTVSYLVFDLDTYEEEAVAWLVECLEVLLRSVDPDKMVHYPELMKCLLMENSGGKGFHAWLFLSSPLPARQVRAWVASSFLPLWEQQSSYFDGTPLEVFPKQDTVAEGGFGNLVKLPFGIHAKSGRRSEIVPCQGWANDVDNVQRLDSSLVPEGLLTVKESAGSAATGTGEVTAPFRCIAKLIEDGAPQGCRDKAMFHFAHYAHGSGLPEDMVQEWCERVNEGFQPPLTATELRTKVRSAANMQNAHPGCNADWLKDFCPGGEKCFAPWSESKPSTGGSEASAYMDMSPEERRTARLRGSI